MTSSDRVARRIASRAETLFGVSIDAGQIDIDEGFLDVSGFQIGGTAFDSINLVELMVTLEDEAGANILDFDDVEQINTLRKLASHLIATSPPAQLDEFLAG